MDDDAAHALVTHVSLPTLRRTSLPIAQVNPAAYNPRKISDAAMKGLAKSISEFGLMQEMVVNEKADGSYTLVSGHQRLKIIAQRGITEIPVVVVKLSDAKERALNVAMNSSLLTGDWTPDLAELLEQIQAADDVDDGTFEELRLDELLASLADDDQKIVDVKKERLPDLVWILLAIPLSDFGDVQTAVADLQARATVSVQVNRPQAEAE